MSGRQFATPLIVRGEQVVPLSRVPLDERGLSESWLQELLFKHPNLIPVDEIDKGFGPLIPVARELGTASGPLDVLYVNAKGYLTLVETKLWRNPEARRTVVAQVIEFARRWTISDPDLGMQENAEAPLKVPGQDGTLLLKPGEVLMSLGHKKRVAQEARRTLSSQAHQTVADSGVGPTYPSSMRH